VKKILLILATIIILGIAIIGICFSNWMKKAEERLAPYKEKAQTVDSSYGKISYIDEGEGEVILILHGLFGGYDQGYDSMKSLIGNYRVIAPSRFGYIGSDCPEDASVTNQAHALKELLDQLGVEKVYVVGTSAGGLCALKFGILYPESVKGIGLYCSGSIPASKPKDNQEVKYYSVPKPFCNDFTIWAIGPIMRKQMSMTKETWLSVFPVSERAKGVVNDGYEANADGEKNYDDYTLENLHVPVLILHAKDDQMASYEGVAAMAERLPNVEMAIFEQGGHMMTGNDGEVNKKIRDFIEENK